MKINKLKQLLTILLIAFAMKCNAQVDNAILWQKTIGGDYTDRLEEWWTYDAHCLTTDGGFILGITSNSDISGLKTENSKGGADYWIVKLDSSGNILWQNTIGGSLDEIVYSITQTADGGYIVGGTSQSDISGDKTENSRGGNDYWILKLDNSGNVVWQKTYGGLDEDRLASIQQCLDGGYIVAGSSYSPMSGDVTEGTLDASMDVWMLKLDSIGNLEWQNTYNASDNEDLVMVRNTFDGGYVVATTSGADTFADKTVSSYGNRDIWVFRLDHSGNIVWQISLGGSDEETFPLIETTFDGGFLVGAYSKSTISGNKSTASIGTYFPIDNWIVKLDGAGNIQWDRTIGSIGEDQLRSIRQQSDGGFLLGSYTSGWQNSIDDRSEDCKGLYDYWITKTDSLGNISWENSLGGSAENFLAIAECTEDGKVFVIGSSNSNISGDKSENSSGLWDVWVMKLKAPSHVIHGTVFADSNLNCTFDSYVESRIPNKIVKENISGNNVISEIDGSYKINVYQDSAILSISNLESFESIDCLPSDSIFVLFDSLSASDTFNINFPLVGPSCSHLNVNVASAILHPCQSSNYSVPYSNNGYGTAINASLYVVIDTSILSSISSSSPYTQSGDTLLFLLGNILPFQSGLIEFQALVNCDAIIGTSTCVRTYIYPLSDCPPPIIGYDSSDIEVETSCLGDTVVFLARNKAGANNMNSPGTIRVIEDDILLITFPIQLAAAEDTIIKYRPANDKTLTLEFYQNPNHPFRPIIIEQNELCSITTPFKLTSVIDHFPRFDDMPAYEEVCSQILASFDPNMKNVVPEGFTAQHYTDSNQILEYRIDFQNTGLASANIVIIADTLSDKLEVSSFVPLVASHSYITQFVSSNVVHFIFDSIALPDSSTDEAHSHGYVTFKIRPKFNTPRGTIINNFADIYFDYNDPVRTNTVFNTIYDTVLMRIGVGIDIPKENLEAHVLVFPNPTNERFIVLLNQELMDANIRLTDASGREVYQMNQVSGNSIEMHADKLSKGVYFIQVYEKNKLIARSKIVIQ